MVATGVADRARDRVAQLIYLDAFVPRNGRPWSILSLIGGNPGEPAGPSLIDKPISLARSMGRVSSGIELARAGPKLAVHLHLQIRRVL
jgi:hypothetical protein